MTDRKSYGDGQPAVSLPPASIDSAKLASGLKSVKSDEAREKAVAAAQLGKETDRPEPSVAPDQKLVKVEGEHGETEMRVSVTEAPEPAAAGGKSKSE